ncbi:MAG: hypothetical protein HYT94_03865 [Parcubacteria group bacterium]|nr:hypothetical protein [Parcubacteria group bacterium]
MYKLRIIERDEFTEEQIRKGIIFNCGGGVDDEMTDIYGTIIQGSKESTIGLPVQFIMDMVEKVK